MRAAAVAAVVVAVLTGCVTNPVGPVRSAEAYRSKASSSIADATSAVGTVRTVGAAEIEGSSFTAFSVQVADDSLDGVRTAQDTFETIVPPDPESASLQPQVLDALAASRRGIIDVLTALQREDRGGLEAAVVALDELGSELDELQATLEGSS